MMNGTEGPGIAPAVVARHVAAARQARAIAFRQLFGRLLRRLVPPPAVRQPCREPCPRHAETSGW